MTPFDLAIQSGKLVKKIHERLLDTLEYLGDKKVRFDKQKILLYRRSFRICYKKMEAQDKR